MTMTLLTETETGTKKAPTVPIAKSQPAARENYGQDQPAKTNVRPDSQDPIQIQDKALVGDILEMGIENKLLFT
jgi:hypothetical protein